MKGEFAKNVGKNWPKLALGLVIGVLVLMLLFCRPGRTDVKKKEAVLRGIVGPTCYGSLAACQAGCTGWRAVAGTTGCVGGTSCMLGETGCYGSQAECQASLVGYLSSLNCQAGTGPCTGQTGCYGTQAECLTTSIGYVCATGGTGCQTGFGLCTSSTIGATCQTTGCPAVCSLGYRSSANCASGTGCSPGETGCYATQALCFSGSIGYLCSSTGAGCQPGALGACNDKNTADGTCSTISCPTKCTAYKYDSSGSGACVSRQVCAVNEANCYADSVSCQTNVNSRGYSSTTTGVCVASGYQCSATGISIGTPVKITMQPGNKQAAGTSSIIMADTYNDNATIWGTVVSMTGTTATVLPDVIQVFLSATTAAKYGKPTSYNSVQAATGATVYFARNTSVTKANPSTLSSMFGTYGQDLTTSVGAPASTVLPTSPEILKYCTNIPVSVLTREFNIPQVTTQG